MHLSRRLCAEFVGTAGLVTVVVGSGIMGERLSNNNAAIVLLANSLATGAGLIFLILALENISSHFNPAVTLTKAVSRAISLPELILYLLTQICGGMLGAITANLMFDLPIISFSTKVRTGFSQWLGECVATFGLIGVIRAGERFNPKLVFLLVAAYITAAYWFTSSTSFANPAVTIARMMSDSFTGIRPTDVVPFIVAQLAGAVCATALFDWLFKNQSE